MLTRVNEQKFVSIAIGPQELNQVSDGDVHFVGMASVLREAVNQGLAELLVKEDEERPLRPFW